MCNNAQKSLFFPICKLPLASSQISKNTVCLQGGNDQNCKQSGRGLKTSVWEKPSFSFVVPHLQTDRQEMFVRLAWLHALPSFPIPGAPLDFPRLTSAGQISLGYSIKQVLKGLEYKK